VGQFEKRHKQLWAKVNAPVDEQIKNLVEALSRFPKLQTIESCQGISEGSAWVCFYYGQYWLHPWRDLASFVLGFLGPRLTEELQDIVDLVVRVTTFGTFRAELTIRPGCIKAVTEILVNLSRMYVCSYDK
jgi:hypothetical protein